VPFLGDTFTHLFDWEKDPQRQEKIINARLQAEFGGIATGITQLRGIVRERVSASRNYYVRTDGSDSNTGLVDSAGGAFLTIQKAIDTVAALDWNNLYFAIINVRSGTYTGTVRLKPIVGLSSSPMVIVGDQATPSNVVISCTNANAIVCESNGWDLRGFKTQTTTAGNHILVQGGAGFLTVRDWDFGVSPTGWSHIECSTNAYAQVFGDYAITGNCGFAHWYAHDGGRILAANQTITLTGTPAFASAFAFLTRGGGMLVSNNTFSGSATGIRYSVSLVSYITTFGGGATYLPGNVGGTADAATYGSYS
jgi:hypothetical protein